MSRPHDLNKSPLPFDQPNTLIAVIEMSQSNWLVAGIVPGVERQPLKKLEPDEQALFRLLQCQIASNSDPISRPRTTPCWRVNAARLT